jgi:deoxyribodipyrimidine photo-lyase
VAALFVLDPYFFLPRRARRLPHRMQFLLESIDSLQKNLKALGLDLLLVSGRSTRVVPEVVRRLGIERVLAQRWVEPFGQERDRRVTEALDVPLELHEGETLHSLGTLRSTSGSPYETYTPFANALQKCLRVGDPLPVPKALRPLQHDLPSERPPTLADLGIQENRLLIRGGERAARERLGAFSKQWLGDYALARDRLDQAGTSRLSADLKFGTLSPRAVYRAAVAAGGPGAERFIAELLWREFTHSTLHDQPELLERAFRPSYDRGPWLEGGPAASAWKSGHTGIPIVDAAARQLLEEGFVHNRARMIAASFLTKHLRQHYRVGEEHYLRYLVDGDWAQNNFGWQWSAGCGVSAQPYFRVMNPVAQGQKFDPEGVYVRRHVPELARLPREWVHQPWLAPDSVLTAAGVRLGVDYPRPIVDLKAAREEYLQAAGAVFKRERREG